jgi:endonuclease/exonuclease/phosphatase (EEP) superfamily protein YafD
MPRFSKLVTVFSLIILCSQVSARRFEIPRLGTSFKVFGSATEQALNPEKFSVVIWNILKAKKRKFPREFKSFGKVDAFMLQEVSLVSDFFKSYEAYENHEIHFGASFSQKKRRKRIESGTAISSIVRPVDSGMMRTTQLEPFVKTPKVVTWMKLPFQGKEETLLLVNIHGLNLTKNRDFRAQMQECKKLIDRHSGPVIFAGDFNTSDLEKYNDMISVIQKTDLVPVAFMNDERKRSRFSKLVIDHAFIRGMDVIQANVFHKLKSSDHKAMGLRLSLK